MAMNDADKADLQKTIRFAVEGNCAYGAKLETWPTTSTWDGLAQYPLANLGMDNKDIANMWWWVNHHLPPTGKEVAPAAQGKCNTVGDVFDACVKAAK